MMRKMAATVAVATVLAGCEWGSAERAKGNPPSGPLSAQAMAVAPAAPVPEASTRGAEGKPEAGSAPSALPAGCRCESSSGDYGFISIAGIGLNRYAVSGRTTIRIAVRIRCRLQPS